jgi:hypothetical protein
VVEQAGGSYELPVFFLASGLGVKLKKAEKVNQNKYQLR